MAERSRGGRIDDKGGLSAKQWLLVACAILLLLFFALNFQTVQVSLIVAKVDMPLIVALVIAALLGALIAWLAPRLRRDRGGESR
ncbi:MAG: LapA family protein [Solirubrobacterales bacterium]